MAKYMTQSMSSANTETITYYRQQSAHPSHAESGQFTADAIANYAAFNHIEESAVVKGTYRSDQGVPTGGKTYEI